VVTKTDSEKKSRIIEIGGDMPYRVKLIERDYMIMTYQETLQLMKAYRAAVRIAIKDLGLGQYNIHLHVCDSFPQVVGCAADCSIITINLCNCTDIKDGVDAVFHELRHVWQIFNSKLLRDYPETSIFCSDDEWAAYRKHPAEVDARRWAKKACKQYINRIMEEL
jgi:hypothetical protein